MPLTAPFFICLCTQHRGTCTRSYKTEKCERKKRTVSGCHVGDARSDKLMSVVESLWYI